MAKGFLETWGKRQKEHYQWPRRAQSAIALAMSFKGQVALPRPTRPTLQVKGLIRNDALRPHNQAHSQSAQE